jgi:serine/threonine protein kinase
MGERVRVMRHEGRLLAAKEPGPRGAAGLRAEAELLHRVQVPGVVELVGLRGGEPPALLTHWVGPRSLNDLPVPLEPARAAAIVLAVTATVGRLHRSGVAHGDLDPTHVLLDADGRPVLCGFGSAGPIGAPVRRPATDPGQGEQVGQGRHADGAETLRPSIDVAGLGRLLQHLLGDGTAPEGASRWGRAARAAAGERRALRTISEQATDPDPLARPSVTAFARAVRRAVPAEQLELGPTPATVAPRTAAIGSRATSTRGRSGARHRPAPLPRRGRSVFPAVVALVAIGSTTYFGLSAWLTPVDPPTAVATPMGTSRPDAGPSRPSVTSTSSSTLTTATSTTSSSISSTAATSTSTTVPTAGSSAPVIEREGRRFQIGGPGDVVVVEEWLCDGRELPAVLRPSDGTIHLFTEWAPVDGSATALVVATVPGASGLEARRGVGSCAELLVTDADQVLATLTSEELR